MWERAAAGLLAAALTLLVACRSPTEIEVTVTTDVPCAAGAGPTHVNNTAVFAGASVPGKTTLPVSVSYDCDPSGHVLGEIVLVPSGDRSATVNVVVATGVNGQAAEDCLDGNGALCIIEERRWNYQPHHPVPATIFMTLSCLGKDCTPGTTCFDGACVPVSDCNFETCGPEDAGVDAGVDGSSSDASKADATLDSGGVGSPDATIPSDASLDGADADDTGASDGASEDGSRDGSSTDGSGEPGDSGAMDGGVGPGDGGGPTDGGSDGGALGDTGGGLGDTGGGLGDSGGGDTGGGLGDTGSGSNDSGSGSNDSGMTDDSGGGQSDSGMTDDSGGGGGALDSGGGSMTNEIGALVTGLQPGQDVALSLNLGGMPVPPLVVDFTGQHVEQPFMTAVSLGAGYTVTAVETANVVCTVSPMAGTIMTSNTIIDVTCSGPNHM